MSKRILTAASRTLGVLVMACLCSCEKQAESGIEFDLPQSAASRIRYEVVYEVKSNGASVLPVAPARPEPGFSF
jgi:hypothetical protein